jgi:hypothetical protein
VRVKLKKGVSMMNVKITISSHKYSHEEIKSVLAKQNVLDASWKLQNQPSGMSSRGLDTTILVAIVGATGTGVGALIAGLFQLITGKKDEKIVLRTSGGMTIEFPASLSAKRLDEMIDKLKQLEDEKLHILLP